MLRKISDKIFSSNIFYIIFSLLVAFALWIYVEISMNETVNHAVTEIPITLINEELLRSNDFMISSMNPETVNLTFVDCPRNLQRQLTRETISITVDLATITTTGYHQLPFEMVLPQGITRSQFSTISRSTGIITLNIDRLYEKNFPVEALFTGGAADGFIAGNIEISPQTILIEGPESVVDRISRIWVPVEQTNLSVTYTENLPFVLFDEDDEELPRYLTDSLSFSQDTIRVTVPINMLKTIVLDVDFIEGAGATAQNTVKRISPESITVSGPSSDLADLNILIIGRIDLTSFIATRSEMITIALPNTLTNLSGETQALVELEIKDLETTVISVPNPSAVNVLPEHSVTYITQTHDVRIRGKAADIADVSAENISVVADLTDYTAGMHTVPARVYIHGVEGDVGAVGNYSITLRIIRDPESVIME